MDFDDTDRLLSSTCTSSIFGRPDCELLCAAAGRTPSTPWENGADGCLPSSHSACDVQYRDVESESLRRLDGGFMVFSIVLLLILLTSALILCGMAVVICLRPGRVVRDQDSGIPDACMAYKQRK